MKILFISERVPWPLIDGYRIRVFHLLQIAATKHEVSLLTLAQSAEDIEAAKALKSYCTHTEVVFNPKNTLLRPTRILLSILSVKPYAVIANSRQDVASTVSRMMKNIPFDVVIAEGSTMAHYIIAEKMFRILDAHNIEYEVIRRCSRFENNPFKKAFLFLQYRKMKRYEQDVCRRMDCVLFVSTTDQEVFRYLNPRTMLIPNGADIAKMGDNIGGASRKRLIFVGLLNYRVNVDAIQYFCRYIFPLIREKDPDVELQIIGARPIGKVRSLAGPGILVEADVKDVKPFICDAQVFVVPLRSGGGTRIKILEAMSLGTPVVSTSIGCEGLDVVRDEHILIADTSKEFAEQVIRLVRDAPLRRKIALAARRLVEEKYDWKRIGLDFLKTLESISHEP